MRDPLTRWRVLALVVGTLLMVLVGVGLPLKYAAASPSVVAIVGPTHGFLYMAYVLATLDLSRRRRWTKQRLAVAIAAGLVPLLTFVVERRVSREALVLTG